MNAFTMNDVVVKYGRKVALNGCSLEVPAGRLVALVGANGAGKTTLLNCIGGLEWPFSGNISVLNNLEIGSLEARSRIAFVAQDSPLYRSLTIDQMVYLAANLNEAFDRDLAYSRFRELELVGKVKIKNLSLGQQAQVSLSIALGRHPDLLILDEPLARLDPIARNRFMKIVLEAALEEGVSVVFSSHAIAELEPVADYLILLKNGQVSVAEDIDTFAKRHRILNGPTHLIDSLPRDLKVLDVRSAGRHSQVLVQFDSAVQLMTPEWESDDAQLEELILSYLTHESAVERKPSSDNVVALRSCM